MTNNTEQIVLTEKDLRTFAILFLLTMIYIAYMLIADSILYKAYGKHLGI